MADDLFDQAEVLLDEGSFTATGNLLGEGFDRLLIEWQKFGRFEGKDEMLAEAFTCACFEGRSKSVAYLLEHGVDANGGNKTGLNALHWASNRGHRETVKLLLEKGADTESVNMYGGTVLGQVLWSAVNEPNDSHAKIIEVLIDAGAAVESGTLDWWNEQDVPSAETKRLIAETLTGN
jgi:ankyrin repeat protein